jgi:hypothetical protein
MRLTIGQFGSDADDTRPKLPSSAWIRNVVVRAIRWLIEFSTLSENEQTEAGIFLGGEGRNR